MAEYDIDPPPPEALAEMDPSHTGMLLNLADQAPGAAATPSSQPIEVAQMATTASPVSN